MKITCRRTEGGAGDGRFGKIKLNSLDFIAISVFCTEEVVGQSRPLLRTNRLRSGLWRMLMSDRGQDASKKKIYKCYTSEESDRASVSNASVIVSWSDSEFKTSEF